MCLDRLATSMLTSNKLFNYCFLDIVQFFRMGKPWDEEEGTRNCASLYGNIFYGACLS